MTIGVLYRYVPDYSDAHPGCSTLSADKTPTCRMYITAPAVTAGTRYSMVAKPGETTSNSPADDSNYPSVNSSVHRDVSRRFLLHESRAAVSQQRAMCGESGNGDGSISMSTQGHDTMVPYTDWGDGSVAVIVKVEPGLTEEEEEGYGAGGALYLDPTAPPGEQVAMDAQMPGSWSLESGEATTCHAADVGDLVTDASWPPGGTFSTDSPSYNDRSASNSSSYIAHSSNDPSGRRGSSSTAHDPSAKQMPCPYCGRTFKWKGNLKRHILTHTGEKPYNCDTCGEVFNQRSNLVRHERIHTHVTRTHPYTCDMNVPIHM
jgi:uncharacterized C2H2 Zn-finger protein